MKQYGHVACNDCVSKSGMVVLDCYEIRLFGAYQCDLCHRKLDTQAVPMLMPTRSAMRDLKRKLQVVG